MIRSWFRELRNSRREFWSDLRGGWPRIRPDRWEWVLLILFTAIGAFVRLSFMDQPMRCDESATFVKFVDHGLWRVLSNYSSPNNHILHSILVWVSTGLFGPQPWAVRLPALGAGLMLIPVVFFCTRLLFARGGGVLAAGLASVSPYLVLYSTNARGYIMVAVFAMLLVPLVRYTVTRRSHFGGLMAAIVTALGLYTVPTMAFPVAITLLWALLEATRSEGTAGLRRAARLLAVAMLLAVLFTLVLYLPPLCATSLTKVVANKHVRAQSLELFAAEFPLALSATGSAWCRDLSPAVTCVFLAGLLLALALAVRRDPRMLLLFAAVPTAIFILMLIKRRVPPSPRTWVFLLPISFVMADAGLIWVGELLPKRAAKLWRHGAGVIALAAALTVGHELTTTRAVVFYGTEKYTESSLVVEFCRSEMNDGDVLVVGTIPRWMLTYYFKLEEISRERLWNRRWAPRGKVYVLVFHDKGDLDWTLDYAKYDPPSGAVFRPVKWYPYTTIYLQETASKPVVQRRKSP